MKCQNPECEKLARRKYCSNECRIRGYYLSHVDDFIRRRAEWNKKNPERSREIVRKAVDKYHKTNPGKYNEAMKEHYKKNKYKWHTRARVYQMKKAKNPIILKEECKKCGSLKDLKLKFEDYPKETEEIRNLINKKIYYICKKCRLK